MGFTMLAWIFKLYIFLGHSILLLEMSLWKCDSHGLPLSFRVVPIDQIASIDFCFLFCDITGSSSASIDKYALYHAFPWKFTEQLVNVRFPIVIEKLLVTSGPTNLST